MNDPSGELRAECDRRIRASEDRIDEDLNSIRLLDEQWENYRRVIRDSVNRFKEAGHSVGAESRCAQQDLAALGEIGTYAERLAGEQNELSEEASRAIRTDGEAEIERLRNERSALPWD